MYFDRFDVAEAHWLFCHDYHEGQGSDKYARLCRIQTWLSPRPNLSYQALSENGKAIYDALVAKERAANATRIWTAARQGRGDWTNPAVP